MSSRRSITVDAEIDDTGCVTIPLGRLADGDLDALLAEMKARGKHISGDVIDLKQAEQLLEIRRCLAAGHVRDATRRLDDLIHDLIDLAKEPKLDSYGEKQRHALYGLCPEMYAVTCLPEPV